MYIKYSNQIEIEIKMTSNLMLSNIDSINRFINVSEKYKPYYHIYFDEGKEEKKRNFITKNEQVSKIKV